MKRTLIILLAIVAYFNFEARSQDWKFYTKEASYDGKENIVAEPFLIDLDLTSHVLIKIDGDSYYQAELTNDKIIYSGWGATSHVIMWNNVDVNGDKQTLVYYSDMSDGKTDFCMLSEISKICFLNIKKF
jgi:hypothetical protein